MERCYVLVSTNAYKLYITSAGDQNLHVSLPILSTDLICQLKFFYYLKTQLRVGGRGGGGGQGSRTEYL